MRVTTLRVMTMIALLTAMLAVPVLAGHGETIVVEGKRVYLVRPGDTLAGIAAAVLGDSRRWKEIWQANPQIRKPGLIFPGDSLIVGDDDSAAATASFGGGGGVPAPVEAVATAAAPLPLIAPSEFMEGERFPAEPVATLVPVSFSEAPAIPRIVFETCGFISSELPESAIIGSPDGRLALSQGDTVFIDRGDRHGLTVGQEFRVLQGVRRVRHPRSGVLLGWQVRVAGMLRIDCLQRETATATVIASYSPIRTGDRVEPFMPERLPDNRYLAPAMMGPCVPAGTSTATLLGSKEEHLRLSQGDVVYLDRGLSTGVVPGSRLAVVREGYGGRTMVGELQVLLSQNYTSTALVVSSSAPLTFSDGLILY